MIDFKKVPAKATQAAAAKVLANWKTLAQVLPSTPTAGVRDLLWCELHGKRRMYMVQRLVARYSALEAQDNERATAAELSRLGPV